MKDKLVEHEEYILVPEEVWDKLVSWYGIERDQPAIERKVRNLQLRSRVFPLEFGCPAAFSIGVNRKGGRRTKTLPTPCVSGRIFFLEVEFNNI